MIGEVTPPACPKSGIGLLFAEVVSIPAAATPYRGAFYICGSKRRRAGAACFMRTVGTVVTLLLLLGLGPAWLPGGPASAYAQDDSTALVEVEAAFRSADVEALLDGAAERVDVVIFGKGASYSRAQAALVLLDFFRRNPPLNVAFEQQVIAEDRRSMIGQYWVADGGDPMAVSVRLRARDEGWQVRAIRIERRGR